MADEKLLNALVSRVASRELVSLVFLTIASSASLVLLSFTKDIDAFWWVSIIGIFFPVLALTYNEVTRFTIHKHDQKWIRKIINEDKETTYNSKEILEYTKTRVVRMLLSRMMLLIPVFGWIIIIPLKFVNEYENLIRGLGIVGVIITIILL